MAGRDLKILGVNILILNQNALMNNVIPFSADPWCGWVVGGGAGRSFLASVVNIIWRN